MEIRIYTASEKASAVNFGLLWNTDKVLMNAVVWNTPEKFTLHPELLFNQVYTSVQTSITKNENIFISTFSKLVVDAVCIAVLESGYTADIYLISVGDNFNPVTFKMDNRGEFINDKDESYVFPSDFISRRRNLDVMKKSLLSLQYEMEPIACDNVI